MSPCSMVVVAVSMMVSVMVDVFVSVAVGVATCIGQPQQPIAAAVEAHIQVSPLVPLEVSSPTTLKSEHGQVKAT